MRHGCAALVVAAVLAGCSTSDGRPAAPATAPVTEPTASRLSPPVEQPRNLRGVADRPCELFTAEQLAALGFDQPGEPRTLSPGTAGCTWTDSERRGELAVVLYPDLPLLERTYSSFGSDPVFEPITIAGLPAVVRQVIASSATCSVTIGVAEQQGFDVTFTDLDDPPDDPCGTARRAADTAVGNLPPLT
jgi:hypothetical protein